MIKNCPFYFEENNFIFLGTRGKKLKAEIIQKEIRNLRNSFMLPDNTTPHSLDTPSQLNFWKIWSI